MIHREDAYQQCWIMKQHGRKRGSRDTQVHGQLSSAQLGGCAGQYIPAATEPGKEKFSKLKFAEHR